MIDEKHTANLETECVFTYRSNSINDLIYGYGGRVISKKNLLEVEEFKVDMTTSIGAKFVPKFEISNVTASNTDRLIHGVVHS